MLHPLRNIETEMGAEAIESGKNGIRKGILGAIHELTKKDLERLAQDFRDMKLDEVAKRSEMSEAILVRVFSELVEKLPAEHRELSIRLTQSLKERLTDILPAIYYLYVQRYGDIKGSELGKLLESEQDEPYSILFYFDRDQDGKYFIKKMILRKNQDQKN